MLPSPLALVLCRVSKNMANIVLIIKFVKDSRNIDLSLIRDENLLETVKVGVGRCLDHCLIEGIDNLLKRNRIEPLSLNRVRLVGHIDNNSSSHKIATAFLRAINISKMARK